MLPTRRSFLAGIAAFSLYPTVSWAEFGKTAFISAAKKKNGSYALFGLNLKGEISFEVPMPDRGHAAAAHPHQAEIVGFARRPGRFALVVDCADGIIRQVLTPPKGRHFYGHGTYSPDGKLLFTSENDYDNATGMIGVWRADRWYERIGEFSSAGVGPHDVKLMPDGKHLVVANGGIETHPDSGRQKLNIPTMAPNLAYLTLDGQLVERLQLPYAMHKNSIRHLGVGSDGQVAFAMQWQGDVYESPALLGLHAPGKAARLFEVPDHLHQPLRGYIGSVAYSAEEGVMVATSPRGGLVLAIDVQSGQLVDALRQEDVCGVAFQRGTLTWTAGTGHVGLKAKDAPNSQTRYDHQWDNHLIAL